MAAVPAALHSGNVAAVVEFPERRTTATDGTVPAAVSPSGTLVLGVHDGSIALHYLQVSPGHPVSATPVISFTSPEPRIPGIHYGSPNFLVPRQ